ncbi:hypothetical protein [Aquimarina sp. AD10]|uniref:hypothetical protein n=1 Tax=Aquimarina sp. AD10 TaxID=1714849 RepID=UPI0013143B90|nr:hypothetical protein [Aquimarina sp. AD10]
MKNLDLLKVSELSTKDKMDIVGGEGTDWLKAWKAVKEVFNDLDYAFDHIADGWNNPK